MAKKKLNSIVWPNIPNDVYYLDADKVEYDDTETYSEGSVGDALQNKANIDGSYENLTAGNAEQLVTGIRANDQTPYLFRTAGGSVDIGDREYINGIVGGTVAWNQQVKNGNFADGATNWSHYQDRGTLEIVNGVAKVTPTVMDEQLYQPIKYISHHKYLASVDVKGDIAVSGNPILLTAGIASKYMSIQTSWTTNAFIFDVNREQDFQYYILISERRNADFTAWYADNFQVFDLTLMFGSTIADYIYSLEQANAGAGVAFFKTLFPKPYYAYNAGELKSVKGLVSHDMTGFNQFDKNATFLNGYCDGSNRYIESEHMKSYLFKIVEGATYYFNTDGKNFGMQRISFVKSPPTPDDTIYNASGDPGYNDYTDGTALTFPKGFPYALVTFFRDNVTHDNYNDILDAFCINLSWDGSEDGNYEPYQKWSYPLDSDLELRGIPKLDASNNLYYDGDIYEPDGTVTRKYGIVDLGTLDWSYVEATHAFRTYGISDLIDPNATSVLCQKYPCYYDTDWHTLDKLITTWASYKIGNIIVKDTAYSDAATFKTAMSGVYLVYELATPTTETADPYISPQIVDDFGTEEFVISNTIAVPIPVGNNTDYPVNLKAKVEMMPNSPDGDGDYIVRQTNGTNEYVSIANNSTISGLVSRSPVASGADGTYVLKATISGGTVTYSWEVE